MMTPWAERPIEEASLFNPAFGSLTLAKAVADFHKQTGEGIPYPLVFLVMPLALHTETRDALPATTRAVMHNWISEHAPLLSNFPDRVRRMAPVTREAVLFALVHGNLPCLAAGSRRGFAGTGPTRSRRKRQRKQSAVSERRRF
jgi:hypothetical protein